MAYTEFPVGLALTTSAQTVYTVPVGKRARFLLMQIANVDGTNSATANVRWTDASSGSPPSEFHLAADAPVDAGDAIRIVSGALVLETGDFIEAWASEAGDLEMTIAVQELDS